jgi:hypothetical protein
MFSLQRLRTSHTPLGVAGPPQLDIKRFGANSFYRTTPILQIMCASRIESCSLGWCPLLVMAMNALARLRARSCRVGDAHEEVVTVNDSTTISLMMIVFQWLQSMA